MWIQQIVQEMFGIQPEGKAAVTGIELTWQFMRGAAVTMILKHDVAGQEALIGEWRASSLPCSRQRPPSVDDRHGRTSGLAALSRRLLREPPTSRLPLMTKHGRRDQHCRQARRDRTGPWISGEEPVDDGVNRPVSRGLNERFRGR